MDRLLEPTKFLQLTLSGFLAITSYLVLNWLRQSKSSPPGQRWGIMKSNLTDEFKHTPNPPTSSDPNTWKVKSIMIYPVKSCRGVELGQVNVVPTGLEYDRQFMFAELQTNAKTGEQGWVFLTQRNYPLMARILTELYVDRSTETGGTIRVSFPIRYPLIGEWKKSFDIPLDASEKIMSKFPLTPVTIWKDIPLGYDMSSLCSSELVQLRAFLGAKGQLALFRVCKNSLREVYRCAPRADKLGYQPVTGFADAYPVHLMNLASVRDLNSKIKDKIPKLSCLRFRPNIIITGPRAFDEDNWKVLSLGDKIYHAACRTVRCRLPNTHHETGDKHPVEPDRMMRSYRNIDPGAPVNACLGMQLVPGGLYTLTVGDKVAVQERGEHFYIKQ